MTALFCFIPRFLKHWIQNKNDVIRSISSRDVEECHDDATVSRHDSRVCVTMTISIFLWMYLIVLLACHSGVYSDSNNISM